MGEVSVHAQELKLLTNRCVTSWSQEKTDEAGNKIIFDPFADKELRYRQRYVDLVVNPAVRDVLTKRTLILRAIRKFWTRKAISKLKRRFCSPLRRRFRAPVCHTP